MTEESALYSWIPSPDGICYGKWYLPADCSTEQEAQGRHISEFRFGGLYEILHPPKRSDYSDPKDFSAAFEANCAECEAPDVEMIMTSMNFIFLRPYPEWKPQ